VSGLDSSGSATPWQMRFDMRRGPASSTSREDLYRTALEMCAYADKHGCTNVIISEHHGAEDGYLPSALTMAAAAAAVTDRLRINISALILPMLDPIHTAEETLVVDQISGGRVDVIVGLGYVRSELAMFGLEDQSRVRLLEEKLPIYRDALTGDTIVIEGRTVTVTPGPVQDPRPQVLLGGSVPAAARRAARLADGLHCLVPRQQLAPHYLAERERLGLDPGLVVGGDAPMGSLFVSDDPERSWSEMAPHLLHEVNSYGRWAQEAGANEHLYQPTEDLGVVRKMGMYEVVDPEQAVEYVAAAGPAGPILHPLVGGIPPEIAWQMLQRFVDDVLPKLGNPTKQ
jgi:alkanesulfonate monooxygenase SsuD/methylene tetrahydromethanopterin reductase-like flavin-dependent oxidoreductase (luciferase family)